MKNTINEKIGRGIPQQTKRNKPPHKKKSVNSKTGDRTHPQSRKRKRNKNY